MPPQYGIAESIAAETGLPVSVVQFLYNLSRPLRQTLVAFLNGMISQLLMAKTAALMKQRRNDGLSLRVQKLRTVTNAILTTNNIVLKSLPLDLLYKDVATNSTVKAMSDFLTETVRSLPVKIPASVVSYLDAGDLDFFEGVVTYQDLVDRIDRLEFRLARATAASKYAADASFLIDQQIEKITQYKEALGLIG